MAASIVSHQTYLQDVLARQARRRLKIDPTHAYPSQPTLSSSLDAGPSGTSGIGQPSKANVINYVQEEETIRNDYTAWYGVSGRTGANYILGAGDHEICEEYPALRRLMDLKAALVTSQAHPPLYLTLGGAAHESLISSLTPHKFDVILVHPRGSWSETADLPIRQLSADPGFVFLWVGRGDQDGLERGRECLARWGFRRAEDIVWIKPNRQTIDVLQDGSPRATRGDDERGPSRAPGTGGLFASQKEHCLMGIRGTVRRSTDTRFVHCNVDTDVMVWEQGEDDSPYPPYLYTLIESFCLGTRRLQVFAPPHRSRRGWVTASTDDVVAGLVIPASPSTPQSAMVQSPKQAPGLISQDGPSGASEVLRFDSSIYPALMPPNLDGHDVLPYNAEIDALRPKSPQRRGRGGGPTAPGGFGGQSPPPQPGFRGTSFRGGGSRGRGGGGRGTPGQMNFPGPYSGQMQGYGQYDQFGQPGSTGEMFDPRFTTGIQVQGMGMDPMMAMQMQMQMQQMQQMHQMQMMGNMGMGMYGMIPNTGGYGHLGYEPQSGYMMQQPQQQMGGQWMGPGQGQGQYGQNQSEWYGHGQAE